jgi:hypothetical protein
MPHILIKCVNERHELTLVFIFTHECDIHIDHAHFICLLQVSAADIRTPTVHALSSIEPYHL